MKKEEACFGAGCFWHVEKHFSELKGVLSTQVGYMGGNESLFPDPSYEDICRKNTGFAEVVYLTFDPEIISYEKLLDDFFTSHDPTTLNQQGPDFGEQYRSVIFYYSESQKEIAEKSLKKFQSKTKKQIVTEIVPAQNFYRAEEYHQKYFIKHPIYCKINNIFS